MCQPLDTPAFQRLARAQAAYKVAFDRALDAGAIAAAAQLEDRARQLNALSDFAELVYGTETEDVTR